MENKEAFHRFFKTCTVNQPDFWEIETAWDSQDYLHSLMMYLAVEMSHVNKEEKWLEILQSKAAAFVQDLQEIKEKGMVNSELCDALQFFICSLLTHPLTSNKLRSAAYNWLCNSLADEISEEPSREFQYDRLLRMAFSKNDLILFLFWRSFRSWLGDVFNYSRHTGILFELCRKILDDLLPVVLEKAEAQPSEDLTNALCQMTAFCNLHHLEEQEMLVNKCLLSLYEKSPTKEIRKIAAYQFAVGNKAFGGLSRREWIHKVRDEFGEILVHHEKFQLLITEHRSDVNRLIEHLDEIKAEIKEYAAQARYPNELKSNYYIGGIFEILLPALICLIISGHVAEANQLIGAYYSIAEGELCEPFNLVIVPNYVTGIVYGYNGNVITNDAPTGVYKDLIAGRGEFLRIPTALRDDPNYIKNTREKYGKPNIEAGPALQAAMETYFDLKKIKSLPGIEQSNGFCLLSDVPMPIQNLISLQLGKTLPLMRNFFNLRAQRPVKKVFIWEGETYFTEIERTGLQEIFESKGIEVVVKIAAGSTKEEFLEHFKSPDYDVFWILSHGEYDHFQAHNSVLNLGNGIIVSIEELHSNNYNGEKRRLLLMDLCDGATASMNNPGSVGLGTSLTHAGQSLMGFSWPVENLQSLILGLLLAGFLAEGATYEEAHYQTVNLFHGGYDPVLDRLKQVLTNTDIIDRIEHVSFDFKNLYYWAALNYIV